MDTIEQVVQTFPSTEVSQAAADLTARINKLEQYSGVDLKNEMTALKIALLQNPSACLLIQPEDVGKAVAALRNITGMALMNAAKSKEPKAKKEKQRPLTAEELADALNSDEF